ncbi:D-sedoheptulose 7-phosphate isomerase [Methylobacterium radiodurans]|uniref:Phosphoheptose isomerase n=1 Tax=Methylobacterium radiodurans TaxID=2202828 RepID=A0A2U8VLF6_9HYPH|nr:D-sedoheptulose 7-phosphate isomerase [Methylobacterium radiodurans]AWN34433.1 phosphoheptose isomerase [Methylobacterium radiodurans]
MTDFTEYLVSSRDVIQAAIDCPNLLAAAEQAADRIGASLEAGGKLLVFGNGGSAGDAQHIAGEFVSRFNYDRAPLAALALTTDTSVLTAIGNDYGYERVFERQVLALGHPGDVCLALSTSGNSPNVLRAMHAAQDLRLATIGLTGRSGGLMAPFADVLLCVPSDATPLIQQVHMALAHAICGRVEARLRPNLAERFAQKDASRDGARNRAA